MLVYLLSKTKSRVRQITNKKETRMDKIEIDARRVINYDAKKIVGGGYKRVHEPCSYARVIKYLLYKFRMTFKDFGSGLGNLTAQGVNHILNRVPKDRYTDEDIDRYCKVLKINRAYFIKLSDKVEELLQQEG